MPRAARPLAPGTALAIVNACNATESRTKRDMLLEWSLIGAPTKAVLKREAATRIRLLRKLGWELVSLKTTKVRARRKG